MKVYLCRLPFRNYEITSIAMTEKEAIDSVYQAYEKASDDPKSKEEVFEYYGGSVFATKFNEVHWL